MHNLSPKIEEMLSFDELTDEEIVNLFQKKNNKGAANFLSKKYINLVRSKAKTLYLIGADREDIIQEGLMGLFKAMRDYSPNYNVSFRAFAELCVKRQMITAIKTANRQKHIPLNSYVSLNKPVNDDKSERTLIDILDENKVLSPEDIFIGHEQFLAMENYLISNLTPLEWQVMICFLEGNSYQEISIHLKRDVKSIDNALQRIKKKIQKYKNKRNQNCK